MQQTPDSTSIRRFRFNWKMTLFTVGLLPLLISLGLWQLDREQEKIQMQQRYDLRLLQSPVELASVDWSDQDLGWTQIVAHGSFDSRKQFLLDNRILNSQVGYEVITPFVMANGVVLVNRGWVAQGGSRAILPSVDMDTEENVQISGHIYVPSGDTMVLGANVDDESGWPKVIQRIDIEMMSETLEYTLKPHIVRLSENSTGALETNWPAVNMQPEVHRGYAVQWFLMAFVLVVLYLMFSFRKLES